jgi:hypothetical protein
LEVNGSGKHSSLLWYGNNYEHKMFYGTGPSGPKAIRILEVKSVTPIINFICNFSFFRVPMITEGASEKASILQAFRFFEI